MGYISDIKVSMADNNRFHYTDGNITVSITLDNAAFGADYSDEFKCYIYADDFYPMCCSEHDGLSDYEWPVYTLYMNSSHVWLPGKYTLFIRERDQRLTQAVLTLDKQLQAKVTDISECQPLSDADVMTTCLEDVDITWRLMATTPGIGVLRKRVVEATRLSVYNELRKELKSPKLSENRNMLICTVNKDLTEQTLTQFCMLMRLNTLKMVDCSTLYDVTCNNPYEQLTEQVVRESSATFCLTNIGSLLTNGGKVIAKRIIDKLRNKKDDCSLWICGTRQEVDSVLEQYPSLKDFFPRSNRLQLQPYSGFELVQAFHDTVFDSGLVPSEKATDELARNILQGYATGNLSSWSLGDISRFVAEDVRPRYVGRVYRDVEVEKPTPLMPEDIDFGKLSGGRTDFEESIRELNAMIGLKDIKKGITTMANRTRFFQMRRKLGLRTTDKAVYHAIFTGNPGTGKTTVARMLGKAYHSLGLLSRGEVIAVDRTRLVGRYIGETEENMKTVLEEARGNVLFIDEAYTLYDGGGDRKDFGARVIDSLLTVLTQPNPDMLIIFAGYEKEMDAMLQTNPGLFGRFPYKFRFADYDADELLEIARRLLDHEEFVLTDEAQAALQKAIGQTYAERNRNFSNARWVENFVKDGILNAMADRVSAVSAPATTVLYQTIEASDVQIAYEQFNPRTVELHPRRQIGFSA